MEKLVSCSEFLVTFLATSFGSLLNLLMGLLLGVFLTPEDGVLIKYFTVGISYSSSCKEFPLFHLHSFRRIS